MRVIDFPEVLTRFGCIIPLARFLLRRVLMVNAFHEVPQMRRCCKRFLKILEASPVWIACPSVSHLFSLVSYAGHKPRVDFILAFLSQHAILAC